MERGTETREVAERLGPQRVVAPSWKGARRASGSYKRGSGAPARARAGGAHLPGGRHPAASSASNPAQRAGAQRPAAFHLLSWVSHRGVAAHPEEVLISARVTKTRITFLPIDNFQRTSGRGSSSTRGSEARARRPAGPPSPAPLPGPGPAVSPRRAPGAAPAPRDGPRGGPARTPPRKAPARIPPRSRSARPTRTSETQSAGTCYSPRARGGAYRGRRLAARRCPGLPIGPDSAGAGLRREAARTRRLRLELSACARAGGRPGRGRGAAAPPPPPPPSSSSRSAGSSRAPGLPRRLPTPPPARPAAPPPARFAASHWPPPAGPLGPAPRLGAGAVRPAAPRGSGLSRCAVPRPRGARERRVPEGFGRPFPGGGCGARRPATSGEVQPTWTRASGEPAPPSADSFSPCGRNKLKTPSLAASGPLAPSRPRLTLRSPRLRETRPPRARVPAPPKSQKTQPASRGRCAGTCPQTQRNRGGRRRPRRLSRCLQQTTAGGASSDCAPTGEGAPGPPGRCPYCVRTPEGAQAVPYCVPAWG